VRGLAGCRVGGGGGQRGRVTRDESRMPTRPTRSLVAAALAVPLVLTAAPAAAGSADAVAPAARTAAPDRDLREALDALVDAGATGADLRLDDGRRTARLAAGLARLEPPARLRPGARVRVGSVTKTFVATVVLQLAAERRLRLEDTVEQHLPGLVPDGGRITLRMLLGHTSGLFDVVRDQAFFTGVLTDPLREYTPRELIAIATAHDTVFEPGDGWGYSNTNYLLLGLVVERVTHRPVADAVRKRIIEPLGLRDTRQPGRDPELRGRFAHGYLPPALTGRPGYTDITRLSPTALGAAGDLVSTPDDVRRFFRALLGGRLLPPRWLAEMKRTTEARPGWGYGLGLYRMETPCGPVWGNDGGAPGYETVAWNDESGRRGFVLTIPTMPDDAIETAEDAALDTLACRILGAS
jgi:D-alanyl-D-alanine carboxypeptidase